MGAPVAPMPMLVEEVRAEATADRFTHPGRTRAMDSVELMAKVEGYLGTAAFEAGETVEAGAPLFAIQPERCEALAQTAFDRTQELASRNVAAASQLDEARATLSSVRAEASPRRAGHEMAELDLEDTRIHAPFAGRMSAAAYSEGALARIVAEDPMEVAFPPRSGCSWRSAERDARRRT